MDVVPYYRIVPYKNGATEPSEPSEPTVLPTLGGHRHACAGGKPRGACFDRQTPPYDWSTVTVNQEPHRDPTSLGVALLGYPGLRRNSASEECPTIFLFQQGMARAGAEAEVTPQGRKNSEAALQ